MIMFDIIFSKRFYFFNAQFVSPLFSIFSYMDLLDLAIGFNYNFPFQQFLIVIHRCLQIRGPLAQKHSKIRYCLFRNQKFGTRPILVNVGGKEVFSKDSERVAAWQVLQTYALCCYVGEMIACIENSVVNKPTQFCRVNMKMGVLFVLLCCCDAREQRPP